MDILFNRHYISVRNGLIIDGFSDAFRQPADTDICINGQGGYQFRLFPNGEENPMLFNKNGIPLYEYNDAVFARTTEAIAEDEAALPVPEIVPSVSDRVSELENENILLKAQIEAQTEQMDFYEDCIAEMAAIVYA